MKPQFIPVMPEELMSNEEYINAALTLNDISIRMIVNDKYKVFQRLGSYMGRKALKTVDASRDEIAEFLKSCGRIVGKINDSDGRCFKVYDVNDGADADTILADNPDILEEYIVQHPAYSAIYDKSINTLRIHTVRTRGGVKLFFKPFLSIGSRGSVSDHPICDKAMRILLEEDGTIISGVDRWRPYNVMDHHPDTGYAAVPGDKLPYVREACDLCLKAALLIPELRYIGWDVAIGADGPLIVESNSISGLAPKYNSRSNINEMISYGREGVVTESKVLYQSQRFAKLLANVPNREDSFIILLQAALHILGVDFTVLEERIRPISKTVDCSFEVLNEGSEICVSADDYRRVYELPVYYGAVCEEEIYALDKKAWDVAYQIYDDLEAYFSI